MSLSSRSCENVRPEAGEGNPGTRSIENYGFQYRLRHRINFKRYMYDRRQPLSQLHTPDNSGRPGE